MILQAAAVAMALSIDAFTASFAYGSNQIKIPMSSVQIINLICSAVTGLSLLAGCALQNYMPSWLVAFAGFIVLFVLGITKLLDGITKSIIRKHNQLKKEMEFSLFNFHFILNLYANPEKADMDNSKILTSREAASLAAALSLDGFAVGFGAALAGINAVVLLICTLITDMLCIILGAHIGERVARKTPFNISWLGGVILIFMAFLKLI